MWICKLQIAVLVLFPPINIEFENKIVLLLINSELKAKLRKKHVRRTHFN